jgi:hypothetical protein
VILVGLTSRGPSFYRTVLFLGLLICVAGAARAAEPLPDASDVTRRMIERGQAVAQHEQGPRYTFDKRALLERLDAAERPIKSEEKTYQVTWIGGVPHNRLVKIEGRELSEQELKREQAREEKFQRRFVSADRHKMAAQRETLVTHALLDRYEFSVKERVMLSNRATLVLTFKPRAGHLPSGAIHDRLLNRMAGTLWVDEADADTARLVVHLVEPLSLGWFGWLGSLSRFELSLDRQRMPEGVWINKKLSMFLQCRKLATALRFRLTEDSSGFERLETK